MPVLSDQISVAKIAQFENLLRIWDYPQVLTKTVKIRAPFHGGNTAPENYIEGLVWSELGDYVREILQKGKRMSQEMFRTLRQMLMEKLDVYRDLSDEEILENIDELIINNLRESGNQSERKSTASTGTFLFCQKAGCAYRN